jgi:ABC-type nitrate/sulfonate/bicarbonate transport system substrate-binding protein
MKTLKRLAGYVVSMMLIVVLFAGSAPAKEYTVGVASSYGQAAMIVASEKGFFSQESVTVIPRQYWSVEDWLGAIMHQRNDINVAWNSVHIELASSGLREILLGGFIYSQNTTMALTTPEVTPENFTQHRVGMVVDMFPSRWLLWNYLQQHGFTMSDVQIVADMSEQDLLDNFLGGRLKVAVLIGEVAQTAIHEGDGRVIASETPVMSLTALGMSRASYDAMPRDDLKGIMRGIMRAMEWMRDPANERELYDLLKAQWTKGGAQVGVYSSFEAFQQYRRNFVHIKPEDLYEMNSSRLRESYAEAKKVLTAMGKPADFLVYDEAVDTSILLEVLEEMGYGPKPEDTE